MSMRGWNVVGIGFPLYHKNGKKIVEFLDEKRAIIAKDKKNDISKEVHDLFLRRNDLSEEELIDELTDLNAPWWIACIMNKESCSHCFEGCISCGETGVDEHIVYTPAYPFEMTHVERNWNRDVITDILREYANKLNIPNDLIDDVDLEYFG